MISAFDTLPLEILFRILDFISNPHDSTSSSFHPLNSLAAASKHFDSAVEEYTRALLKQHANFAPKKKSKTYTSRKKWLAETSRQRYLVSLLGFLEGPESIDAQKRIRRHDQLMAHMEIAYSTARKVWFRISQIQKEGKTLKKSLATKESRDEFVRNALKTEWATMSTKGSSES
ncbi:hypothetical protein N0V86_003917 [Didymella sp. IMI 355093]|nr:hypothetical protein N0V86_003917 [Didymella sp. IMI 355093]